MAAVGRISVKGLGTALLTLLLAGCLAVTHTTSSGLGYPAGPTLAEFGLDERCQGEDASCMDRAIDLAAQILSSLGDTYDGPKGIGEAAGRFLIDAQHDPPFEWRAADGAGGTTAQVAIDLTDLHDGSGPAFAILGGFGDPEAPIYVVSDDLAQDLLEALFVAAR